MPRVRSAPQPSAGAAASDALPRGLTGRIKGWLDLDGRFLMGPRYIQLLEGIERTGTIRAGCKATRMSYRTCLTRIRHMERALGARLVVTRRGGPEHGRAQLTPPARRLIRVYRAWRDRLEQASATAFEAARRRPGR
jgi:molybdate transport system regulatory protein